MYVLGLDIIAIKLQFLALLHHSNATTYDGSPRINKMLSPKRVWHSDGRNNEEVSLFNLCRMVTNSTLGVQNLQQVPKSVDAKVHFINSVCSHIAYTYHTVYLNS